MCNVAQVHVMVVSTSSSASSASSMHEPLVFLNGCLKNVSNDTPNQKALIKLGALGVLAQLLSHMAVQVRTQQGSTIHAGGEKSGPGLWVVPHYLC